MAAKYRASMIGEDGVRRHWVAVTIEREGLPPRVARLGGIPLKRQRRTILDDQPPAARAYYTELEKRIRANECEICGSTTQIEVHHIRKLNEHRRNGGRQLPAWKQQMIARNVKRWYCAVHATSNSTVDNLTTISE